MPPYLELMAQIEAPKKQAEDVRQAEIAGVIAEILQKIQDYDLTAAEVGFASGAQVKAEAVGRSHKCAAVKPKYRDPASGKTWAGGRVIPKRMKTAVKAGRSRDELLIPEN